MNEDEEHDFLSKRLRGGHLIQTAAVAAIDGAVRALEDAVRDAHLGVRPLPPGDQQALTTLADRLDRVREALRGAGAV